MATMNTTNNTCRIDGNYGQYGNGSINEGATGCPYHSYPSSTTGHHGHHLPPDPNNINGTRGQANNNHHRPPDPSKLTSDQKAGMYDKHMQREDQNYDPNKLTTQQKSDNFDADMQKMRERGGSNENTQNTQPTQEQITQFKADIFDNIISALQQQQQGGMGGSQTPDIGAILNKLLSGAMGNFR